MKNLGEIFIDGSSVNLDTTESKILENMLKKVQTKKSELKSQLDVVLEEIYN